MLNAPNLTVVFSAPMYFHDWLLFIGLHFNSAYAFVCLFACPIIISYVSFTYFCFLPLSLTSVSPSFILLCFLFLSFLLFRCFIFVVFASVLSFWLSGQDHSLATVFLIVYDYLDIPLFRCFWLPIFPNFLAHRPGS